jgi:hypothetical protein
MASLTRVDEQLQVECDAYLFTGLGETGPSEVWV